MASGLASLVGGYGSDSDSDDSTETSHAEKATAPRQGEKGKKEADNDAARTESNKTTALARPPKRSVELGNNNMNSSGSGERLNNNDEEEKEEEHESSGEDSSSAEDLSSEGDEEEGDGKNQAISNTSLPLPSADDLFSSTIGPDFLAAPSAGQEFVVEAMKRTTPKPPPSSSSSTASGSSSNSGDAFVAKRGRETGVVGSGLPIGIKKPKVGGVGPSGPPPEKGKKKGGVGEKISAKDKVKGQRLKGQSGIGSDFRVWKSDLEMTMRQQYD